MDRRTDHGGARHEQVQRLADQAAARRDGLRGLHVTERQPEVGASDDLRRRGRGAAHRPDMLGAARRPCKVVVAPAGGEGRRTRQRQHDRADSKKNILKPHLNRQWVIPPEANAEFVAAMEDVLEVYSRPHDPERPIVCLDETSKQLIVETRAPVPAAPGRPARHDCEYERNGTANLFMVFAPPEGRRHAEVTARRTAVDYGHMLKKIS